MEIRHAPVRMVPVLSEYDASSVESWAIGLKDETREGMWKWYLTGADDGNDMDTC